MTFPLFASIVGGWLARRRFPTRRHDPAQFLATVSHELRTPLNAIVGWVTLLKSGTLASADRARALDCIERNVQLETRLVDQLLDASRLLGGRTTLVSAPIDFRAVVLAAIARVAPSAKAKGLHLALHLSPAELTICGDQPRLVDAVWHLLANAVKFTPADGRVQIDVEMSGDRACLRVADSGEGITPDDLPHVFEPFLQGHTRTKRAGLGLGLAVVRQLIELHGGTVSAHSAGRGEGAVFRLTLPLVSSRSGWRETTAL
jgi:signal transduction histidine kinase